ncbi:MAG: septum formation initiator family protein [Myxococcales bacterium]
MTRNLKLALASGGIALVLAGLSAMDSRGLRRYRKLQGDIAELEEKRGALAAENEALRREIAALSGDTRALERAAREDLGLVRSSEVVYTFER